MSGSLTFLKWSFAIVVSIVALLSRVAAAHADAGKCQAAIIKAGAAFVQSKAKALAKCEDAIVKRKRPAGDCHADVKAAPAIAKAAAKLQGTITKACGGQDKICGTTDDDTLASIGWNIACPNFENGACNGAIASCADIGACLKCIGEAATDRAASIAFDALVPTDPKTEKGLNKCQAAIVKATTAFYVAKSKALAKCWTLVIAGKATNPCPEPGDGKAAAAIAKAETKKRASTCKACGGADKLCNGVGDFTPSAIGFPAQCPAATVPGGSACDGAVVTLADLVACVDCTNEYAVDCADRSAVPLVVPYPAECNGAGGPTPTSTAAVTPTATTTASPTSTVTPTATGATATATPTSTATATATPTATSTAATPTATATATSTAATPTATATATGTATATSTAATPTATATSTDPTPTPTASATPTTTETPTPTATATPSDAIVNMPTLGDYWAIDMPDDIPPLFAPRQRVSNGSALTVSSIRVCLGRQNGTESGPVHFEIWSDKTSGCPNGEPHCQEQQLGDDSDSFEVSALATMGSGTGACGSASNGEEVTITWTGNQPAPSANFWVAGVDDGVTGGEVRWGASAGDTYVDTNFDAWKGDVDRNNDFYFVVAGQ